MTSRGGRRRDVMRLGNQIEPRNSQPLEWVTETGELFPKTCCLIFVLLWKCSFYYKYMIFDCYKKLLVNIKLLSILSNGSAEEDLSCIKKKQCHEKAL